MELMMYIGNDCVDFIAIEPDFITFPGYVGHFVKLLRKKHKDLIYQFNTEPEFLLHNISVKQTNPVIAMEFVSHRGKNGQMHRIAV